MANAPKRIWADIGPNGGWMFRDERMPDSQHAYIRADTLPRWHRIDDPDNPLPMDGTPILACNEDPAAQNPVVIYYEFGSVAFNIPPHWRTSTHDVFLMSLVTHWMPLPILPTQNTPKQKADT